MKICIIAEGSYPFITGGVSSWIQMLIRNFPEHQFVIYAIGAENKNRGKFVYSLPSNVIGVTEVFLDTFLHEKGKWGRRFKLSNSEGMIFQDLLNGRDFNWDELFRILARFDSMTDFILSKSFYDILAQAYAVKFSQTSFVDYFWSVRGMVLPLFNIVKQPIPEADLYHSVSAGYAGVVGALCAYLTQKPYILTEHGIYTREREEEIIKSQWLKGYFKDMWIDFFYSMSRSAYSKADRAISLFGRNREIQIELGCPEEKIQVISNGVSLEEYNQIANEPRDKGEINIGAIVRVVPIKDIKTMIHAFALVKEEIPNASFYIMGPTDEDPLYFEECMQLVELLGVKDVLFTGKVNIKDYIGKIDVMVLTSISEGQPLAILETMACKKPSVATDVGSCRELLYGNNDNYGEAGIVVPVMDYVKIAQAIIELCKNKELRDMMGKNAYNRVASIYTLDIFIDSYRKLYSSLGGA